ncbi:hypothetical protein K505DRAFT_342 [Melanomma pulvis-pyrius CBS 109.77]|uniref:Uncharacterized protein n=1 Tax=Melanomma pulvis-pyrius CBS 109.77 TaxID=1314802 RepID=A0A6A6XXB7_9PLEO|nr:hypothetical protein K505DRAFT_342 [Melanomma pulvis-pyrius CBS 109.77]
MGNAVRRRIYLPVWTCRVRILMLYPGSSPGAAASFSLSFILLSLPHNLSIPASLSGEPLVSHPSSF